YHLGRTRGAGRLVVVLFALRPIGLWSPATSGGLSQHGRTRSFDQGSRGTHLFANQVVAGRGRQHGDPHRQDDGGRRAPAVPLRRGVRGAVHVRPAPVLVPAADLHRRV